MTFLLTHWRSVGVLALVFVLGAYAGVVRLQRDHARAELAREHAEFETFKVRVAAEGEIARQRAEAIAAHDELLKEEADEENRQAHGRLRADIARLRHERDRARSSLVPPAPAASKCPDGQACFDRAELDGALRRYRDGVRGLVDEGSAVTIDLNTAKRWAQDGR